MAAIALLLASSVVHGLDNGLALVPQMGYNTWYDVGCSDRLSEDYLRSIVDKLTEIGLTKSGFKYFNLDDCWALGRYANGSVYADPKYFPSSSLKPLADYVHSKGLLFGTYTDRGTKTCAGRPGASGYEQIDANTYAEWGVDYLKEDSCFASGDHGVAFAEYGKMRDALNATGRPILFSLCGWESWYAPPDPHYNYTGGASLGNSYRIGPDNDNWDRVLTNINANSQLSDYSGPGAWNDPCLLLSADYKNMLMITELQSRTQFSMWAIMASPMIISGNIMNISAMNLETYTNADVIAVNQDPLGKQGKRVVGGDLTATNGTNVWIRELSGAIAIAFVNTGTIAIDITCDAACFAAVGLVPPTQLCGKDLWTKSAVASFAVADGLKANVEAGGGVVMLKLASC